MSNGLICSPLGLRIIVQSHYQSTVLTQVCRKWRYSSISSYNKPATKQNLPLRLHAKFHLRPWREYVIHSWSECCFVFWFLIFLSFLQKLGNYYNNHGYTCNVSFRKISTTPSWEEIRFVHYIRARTMVTDGVASELSIAVLFNDTDVDVHFLKDVRLFPSSTEFNCCPKEVRSGTSHTT